MGKVMTETEKAERRARMEARKAAREARAAERQAEKEAQLAALRKVRDAEDSTTKMRLEAVKLIEKIKNDYYY